MTRPDAPLAPASALAPAAASAVTAAIRGPGRRRQALLRRAVGSWLALLSVMSLLVGCGEEEPPTVNLEELVVSFVRTIPGPDSDAMALPTEAQKLRFIDGLRAAQAGDPERAEALVAPLAYGVRTVIDSVTRRTLYVFEERREEGGGWHHAWGVYVIPAGPSRPLFVEVTHPVHDINTPQVGVQAFRQGDAAGLLVAGAHRFANSDGSSDVAHVDRTMFAEVNRALVDSRHTVLQPHGFDETDRERASGDSDYGDVVVSAGTAPPPPAVDAVSTALREVGFAVCEYDGDRCADLGATQNVEGQWCREVGATFVHLELARDVRDDPARRALAASTVVKTLGSVSSTS